MKSRKMIIAVLLFVAVAVSSATFAYWANSVTGNSDSATGTVNIGEGNAVTTTVVVDNVAAGDATTEPVLVPVGFEDGTASPEEVSDKDKVFTVNWSGDGAEGATGTLAVTVDSIEVNDVDKSGLFTVSVTSGTGAITAGTLQDVEVNVQFTNEPADQTEYTEVANNDVVVTLTYTVTAD